jgi:hypothetical protein
MQLIFFLRLWVGVWVFVVMVVVVREDMGRKFHFFCKVRNQNTHVQDTICNRQSDLDVFTRSGKQHVCSPHS